MVLPIRVFLAVHHTLIRIGLRAVLKQSPDILLLGEAADMLHTRACCSAQYPDVLLLDTSLINSISYAHLNFFEENLPKLRVLLLIEESDEQTANIVWKNNIYGYIHKCDSADTVVEAIRSVTLGALWIRRSEFMELLLIAVDDSIQQYDITGREGKVLGLIAQGFSNMQIASCLNIEPQTVRNYTSRIYGKIGVTSRAEAIVWVRQFHPALISRSRAAAHSPKTVQEM